MWNYYVVPKTTLDKFTAKTDGHPVSHFAEWHWIPLENSNVCLCARFHQETFQDEFEADSTVTCFPHLYLNKAVGGSVSQHVSQHGVVSGDTTFEAALKLRKIHPQFSPKSFK